MLVVPQLDTCFHSMVATPRQEYSTERRMFCATVALMLGCGTSKDTPPGAERQRRVMSLEVMLHQLSRAGWDLWVLVIHPTYLSGLF